MTEIHLKACMLGLMAVTIGVLGGCVISGHDNAVTDGMMVLVGAVGSLGVWDRLKK